MDTNKWLPVNGMEKVTFNVPLTDGGFVRESIVALSVHEIEKAGALGDVVVATVKKDGGLQIISKELVIKRERAEQNLRYGTIRWRPMEEEEADLIYLWVQYDGEGPWCPHMTFEKSDDDNSTSIASDCAAEMQELRDEGHKVKRGGPFK